MQFTVYTVDGPRTVKLESVRQPKGSNVRWIKKSR
jgi:hypothetical protein